MQRFSGAALAPIVERQVQRDLADESAQDLSTAGRRKHDSVWNGVLIGAGAGVLAGGALGLLDNTVCEGGKPMVCTEASGSGVIIGATLGLIVGSITGAIVDRRR